MNKRTIEDYLSTIYRIHETNPLKGVSSIDIAKKLKLAKPSVCEMIKKLNKKKLVSSKPYGKVYLTTEGKTKAKKIIHNHRLIEYFLRTKLKCDLKEVHIEAHELEHSLSQSTINKLDKFLGNPKISPHGKRIH